MLNYSIVSQHQDDPFQKFSLEFLVHVCIEVLSQSNRYAKTLEMKSFTCFFVSILFFHRVLQDYLMLLQQLDDQLQEFVLVLLELQLIIVKLL